MEPKLEALGHNLLLVSDLLLFSPISPDIRLRGSRTAPRDLGYLVWELAGDGIGSAGPSRRLGGGPSDGGG